MSEQGKNPEFGRKIFFLNPSYTMKMTIIDNLRSMEYEIYSIENYRNAKNILRHNKDAILFLNTDTMFPIPIWIAFLQSFTLDSVLRTILVGILSERIREADAKLMFDKLEVRAGITAIGGDLSKVTEVIKGVLDFNGAKGRRQYVRASCFNDPSAVAYWNYNGKVHRLKILDISSVTVAVKIPPTLRGVLKQGMKLPNTTLILGKKYLVMELNAYIIKENPDGEVAIFLYDSEIAPAVKKEIQIYIFDVLQQQMILSINNEPEDREDYIHYAEQDHTLNNEVQQIINKHRNQ